MGTLLPSMVPIRHWVAQAACLIFLFACGQAADDSSPPDEAELYRHPDTLLADPDAQSQTGTELAQAVTIRVSVFDWTEKKPIRGQTEVWLRGVGSWYPAMASGGDIREYPGRVVGAIDTLIFYPIGRESPELKVPVPITSTLCPAGCDRDVVRLEIWDDHYEAWGPNGIAMTFRR